MDHAGRAKGAAVDVKAEEDLAGRLVAAEHNPDWRLRVALCRRESVDVTLACACAPQASTDEVTELMKELDESNDGEVSWEEFLAVMKKMNSY